MQLAPETEAELNRFENEILLVETGESDPDDFKRFRLENGVYGIRGSSDRHMIRLKIPFGRISPEQLRMVADLAEHHTPTGIGHLTTRQDIQLHNVLRADVPRVLRRIAEAGLTTREACGNTVRNVTACPYAGVSPGEAFDVTPYAEAVSAYFLRNPVNQNLPRKFKIAFEGCAEDHARVAIHDIGAVAKIRRIGGRDERGFHIYIAGGLGAQPRSADLLEEFTPADLLIPTSEAVIRVFDRFGERRPERLHRMRARMKFLARTWGPDKLRRTILAERRAILATRSGKMPTHFCIREEEPPEVPARPDTAPRIELRRFDRWLRTNVSAQKQPGWKTVTIRCPLGDLSAQGLRRVASVAERYCGGRSRLTITQNIILRWVPDGLLPWVYDELHAAGLAEAEAEHLSDITRCPGADTCQIALTHSRGLAAELSRVVREFGSDDLLHEISIKISGCMNSCGQHHIADIGFYGAASEAGGHPLPEYIVMVGGHTAEGHAEFGRIAGKVPSRLAPEAARRILEHYVDRRRPGERFHQFNARLGPDPFQRLIEPLTAAPSWERQRELFFDLGSEETFLAEVGVGECAG